MIRLTYVSTCKPGLQLPDIRAMLTGAIASNAAHGITGMLYWSGEYFMQTLEGAGDEVTACYQRICRDARHTEVSLVNSVPAGERWFGQWSMGFTRLLAAHRLTLPNGAKGFNPYLLDVDTLHETLSTLTRNTKRLNS